MTIESDQSYARIEKEIDCLKDQLSGRTYDMYELDLLRSAAAKAAGFWPECSVCQNSLEAISGLLKDAAEPSRMRGAVLKNYSKTFRKVVKHLQENHGIVRRSILMRSLFGGMLLGALPGLAASVAGIIMQDNAIVAIGFGTLFLGIVLGIWLGLRAGRRRSAEAEAEGRFL